MSTAKKAAQVATKRHDPVVVVIAASGHDRVELLYERSLESVKRQMEYVDLLVVVSDNDKEGDPLNEEDIRSRFQEKDRSKVLFLHNSRTRRMSGTGAWNTGIVAAFEHYGGNCWVAILDDDDEWTDDHIMSCLLASQEKGGGDECLWVASGIIRRRDNKDDKYESIVESKPTPNDFYATNPGIQGSNLFANCELLVQAGMFDERLPSTTDRDICIRLTDLLASKSDSSFASTGKHTVIYYAVNTHSRVTTAGSPAKIQGLKLFYYKYAARMDATQRSGFTDRAVSLFGCKKSDFETGSESPSEPQTSNHQQSEVTLKTWSGEELPLNVGTKACLPPLDLDDSSGALGKKEVVIGTITGDIRRIGPLLQDIGCASNSSKSNFRAFVIVLANHKEASFAASVREALVKQNLRGYVLEAPGETSQNILGQCTHQSTASTAVPLPICLARTILQVFIHSVCRKLENDVKEPIEAVAILDDDKRLPFGWTPICNDPTGGSEAGIQIGRDLRTPPNPSLFSVRTNLLDIIFALDLKHLREHDQTSADQLFSFCKSFDLFDDKSDLYYDRSSDRCDHLEMPIVSLGFCGGSEPDEKVCKGILAKLLVGTPFARDVIPPPQSEQTLQRGGCLVVPRKEESSFDVLAIQQDAPIISMADGRTIHSRRSDAFWCRYIHETSSKSIYANASLYVYHDNQFDRISESSAMRRSIVQEVLGGILCRRVDLRRPYKNKVMIDLKLWLSRLGGLLQTLRSRPYYSDSMEHGLTRPLMDIIHQDAWQREVFDVINQQFEILRDFEPRPTNFAAPPNLISLDPTIIDGILFEWDKFERIEHARHVLHGCEALDAKNVICIGIGHEGVVFQAGDSAWKVFDQVERDALPSCSTLSKFGASVFQDSMLPIIRSPFVPRSRQYRGSHGLALLRLLDWMKKKGVGTRNLSPDNILMEEDGMSLSFADLGRDLFSISDDIGAFEERFLDMCRRAFLCYRFGSYANSVDGLKTLKLWMRQSSESQGNIPQLEGFDIFLACLEELHTGVPGYTDLTACLRQHEAKSFITVPASPSPESSLLADADEEDATILDRIRTEIKSVTARRPEGGRVAVCVEFPLTPKTKYWRPLWWYRRHLKRIGVEQSFIITKEDTVEGVDLERIEKCVKYHIFLIEFQPSSTSNGEKNNGCHLMIKSCPLEHESIVADVSRIVHTLERASSFVSITLLVDWSRLDGFLRQFTDCNAVDVDRYRKAVTQIKLERLVDHILEFGPDAEEIAAKAFEVNHRWFDEENCKATHSSETDQQYASTLYGFDRLPELDCFRGNDIVLQCDSDIMFHCDRNCDGISTCLEAFGKDDRLLTVGFPIHSSMPSTRLAYANSDGNPCRFEIRCSFVHLGRLASILPFDIPASERSTSACSCIKRGWWRVLDDVIRSKGWRSARGSIGAGWFFVHPPNQTKRELRHLRMLAIGNQIATYSPAEDKRDSSSCPSGIDAAWEEQHDEVELVSPEKWLCVRNEDKVVIAYGSGVSYGSSLRFLSSLKRQMAFQNNDVGLIIINDTVYSHDVNEAVFEAAKAMCGSVSCLNFGQPFGVKEAFHVAVNHLCGPNTSLVAFARMEGCFLGETSLENLWDLVGKSTSAISMGASIATKQVYHSQKPSFKDYWLFGSLKSAIDVSQELDNLPWVVETMALYLKDDAEGSEKSLTEYCSTTLPVPMPDGGDTVLMKLHVSDHIVENGLSIQIAALSKSDVQGAQNVHVRIHSECLTGDVFYSLKCDCGEQKRRFLQTMGREERAVIVYILGHEGRGAGLLNKIRGYRAMECGCAQDHIAALTSQGCKIDARSYDAALTSLKEYLKIESIILYSNNPQKESTAKKIFGAVNVKMKPIPSCLNEHNASYLHGKVNHLGHDSKLTSAIAE